jgi:hypothetical protein
MCPNNLVLASRPKETARFTDEGLGVCQPPGLTGRAGPGVGMHQADHAHYRSFSAHIRLKQVAECVGPLICAALRGTSSATVRWPPAPPASAGRPGHRPAVAPRPRETPRTRASRHRRTGRFRTVASIRRLQRPTSWCRAVPDSSGACMPASVGSFVRVDMVPTMAVATSLEERALGQPADAV